LLLLNTFVFIFLGEKVILNTVLMVP